MISDKYIKECIDCALKEDLDSAGDITSQSIFDADHISTAVIRTKERGILAGSYLIQPLFLSLDATMRITLEKFDGDMIESGNSICHLHGKTRAILSGERTALNFLQRLSGIATATNHLCSRIADTRTRILDTRKTTPGLRLLEKQAVVTGGGANHRIGLFDMVLIKDTHVKAAGGPAQALKRVQKHYPPGGAIKVEVEVQTFEECAQALPFRPDRIMLDNMDIPTMQRCVELIKSTDTSIELEASGNVTEATVLAIAQTGVDFISAGKITHSAKALDIHLLITDTHDC